MKNTKPLGCSPSLMPFAREGSVPQHSVVPLSCVFEAPRWLLGSPSGLKSSERDDCSEEGFLEGFLILGGQISVEAEPV